MSEKNCTDCGAEFKPDKCTPGYGENSDGERFCYDCCAIHESEAMSRKGRATLYLTGNAAEGWEVTDWPGRLRFSASVRVGGHNITGKRYDAWFKDCLGRHWHGVTYGDNTQICHCKRLKAS